MYEEKISGTGHGGTYVCRLPRRMRKRGANQGDNNGGGNAGGTQSADGGAEVMGNGETIVMAFMNWKGMPAGTERISQKISEYTMEKYGVNVELQILDAASYAQNMKLMLSSGEQVDIFNSVMVGYNACINNGYTLDLEENGLLQTYGQGIIDTFGDDYIDACRVNGTVYGLPTRKDDATGLFGIAIGAEYLDGIGYDYKSLYASEGDEVLFSKTDEITSIFTQLHEKFPDLYVFSPQDATISQSMKVDALGGDNFGVLLDPENSLVVEDLFSSDTYYNLIKLFYDWNQAGFISKDALTDTNAATLQVLSGNAMAYATATKPGIKQQETNLCGREMIIFQCGEDFLKSNSIAGTPWCINSGTEYPELAMTVLNGFYTDPVLSNLLLWGEEGTEYVKTDDGHIKFPEGIDADSSEYYNNVNWELPNQFIAEVWEGDSLDIWDRMTAFNSESTTSKALGFSFDNSAVASEFTALTNVYNEYGKALLFGFTDPDVGIPEFEARLKEAGLEKYMAAKQEALDAWAQEAGVQ